MHSCVPGSIAGVFLNLWLHGTVCVFIVNSAQSRSHGQQIPKGLTYAFCMRCNHDISMGLGGAKDLKRHEQTSVHLRSEKGCVGAMP